MAFADTSNYTLAYAKETTFDVAPTGSAVYKLLRNTGESMNTSLESAKSSEIDSGRQYTGSVHVSGSSAGAVNIELSYGEYDDFLESALQSSGWSTAYSDSATTITSNVLAVTSTTNLFTGAAVKIAGLTVGAENGIYTVLKVINATSFSVVEPLTDFVGSAVISNGGFIKNESTPSSYTFEKDFQVAGTSNFFLMSGMTVGSMSLALSTGSIVSGDFSFQGATGTHSNLSKEDSGTYIPSLTNELMNAVNNVKGIDLSVIAADGTQTAVTGVTFQDLSLSVDNALRDQTQIGSLFAAGIGSGRITVESSASIYFSTRDLFTQFLANSSLQLRFRLQDNAGNLYACVIPEVKVASHEVTASGADADVMASISLSAVKDVLSGTGSSVRITRIPA